VPKPPSRSAPEGRLVDAADADLAPLSDSHAWPGREVRLNTTSVYVRTTPTDSDAAEPALFVHGLGGSAHNWTDLAALLRNRLAIDALDLPGHGRSPAAVRRDYSPEAHAQVVVEYLEVSDRGPVHLVGNSMGGLISIIVASRRPDLVRTLTLISPAVPDNRVRVFPLQHNREAAVLAVPFVGDAVMRRVVRARAPEVRVATTIALCFHDKSRYPEQRMREAVDEARARLDMPWANDAFLRSMRALGRSQLLHGRTGWAAMRAIKAPTLVVWGDKDRLVAPDLAPYVAAAIPDARLLILPDIGHVAMMEDPPLTARGIVGLLDDADRPTTQF
jgi:pimeloyl-ACP methyl ester carboxylesterase